MASRQHIIKGAQVVLDPDIIEHSAEPTQRHAKTIRPTKAAKLTATLHVWFEIEEYLE